MNLYLPLVPGAYYHVFNRGNNRENVFVTPANAAYFLRKYAHYLSPVADTYAYCLLPNHFHLLIRVKTAEEIRALHLPDRVGALVSERFRLLFMSYAKAINKQEGRVGSLFQKNFKRLHVGADDYLRSLVLYIHANPQLHRLCDRFEDWPNSSFAAFLSDHPTRLRRTEVLDWFGGADEFVRAHQQYVDWKTTRHWPIEIV